MIKTAIGADISFFSDPPTHSKVNVISRWQTNEEPIDLADETAHKCYDSLAARMCALKTTLFCITHCIPSAVITAATISGVESMFFSDR